MDSFGRIINDKHFNRLVSLIDQSKVVQKPITDAQIKLISPTILKDVTWEDKVMQEEIFGPILPILKYTSLNDLVSLLKTKDKSLALYMFSNNKKHQRLVFENISIWWWCN